MSTRSYPLRVPSGLLSLAELKSMDERIDRATALRQWLYTGAESDVLDMVARGRLSIGRAAELLDVTVSDIQVMALDRGITIGATGEQTEVAIHTAHRLAEASDE